MQVSHKTTKLLPTPKMSQSFLLEIQQIVRRVVAQLEE